MRAPLFLISFALSSAACSGTADDSGQGAASQDESGAAAEGAGDDGEAAAAAGDPASSVSMVASRKGWKGRTLQSGERRSVSATARGSRPSGGGRMPKVKARRGERREARNRTGLLNHAPPVHAHRAECVERRLPGNHTICSYTPSSQIGAMWSHSLVK